MNSLSFICSMQYIFRVFLPLFYTFIAKIETGNEREEKSMTCNKDPLLELHGQCCSNLSAAKAPRILSFLTELSFIIQSTCTSWINKLYVPLCLHAETFHQITTSHSHMEIKIVSSLKYESNRFSVLCEHTVIMDQRHGYRIISGTKQQMHNCT